MSKRNLSGEIFVLRAIDEIDTKLIAHRVILRQQTMFLEM